MKLFLSTMSSFELIFTASNLDFQLTLTWSIFCNQESIVWSTKNRFENFRINNCFCQIPWQSVVEVLLKLIWDDLTFNEFVFRTCGSLLLSELLASSRIRHGGSPLSGSPWKCILLSEVECHVNKQLTSRARSSRIGEYWPSVVAVRTSLRPVRTVTTSG